MVIIKITLIKVLYIGVADPVAEVTKIPSPLSTDTTQY